MQSVQSTVETIENLCDVEINKVTSHAIQLSGSQFRIPVTEPMQLTRICHNGSTKVENHSWGIYPDVNGKLPQGEYSGQCIHPKSPCHFVTTVNSSASHPEGSEMVRYHRAKVLGD